MTTLRNTQDCLFITTVQYAGLADIPSGALITTPTDQGCYIAANINLTRDDVEDLIYWLKELKDGWT